jgi:hypothetical protein
VFRGGAHLAFGFDHLLVVERHLQSLYVACGVRVGVGFSVEQVAHTQTFLDRHILDMGWVFVYRG